MFRDPSQLKVHQLADQLALALVQSLSSQSISPIGCTLSSAAVRPALRIQEACRRPGQSGFADGLLRAAEAAQELHYLCSLGARSGLVAPDLEAQALHLVKALWKLHGIDRRRTVEGAPRDSQTA